MIKHVLIILLLVFTSILILNSSTSTYAAPPPPPTPADENEEDAVKEAVEDAIDQQRAFVLGFLVYEVKVINAQVSTDGQWGIALLELFDPETNQFLPIEPGLAITYRTNLQWQVTLPADAGWLQLLQAVPEELLPADRKAVYQEMNAAAISVPSAIYSGYLLPWEAGKTVYVSQTVGHDQYIPSGSAHFAFDFYLPQTMYRLYASKAGTVWRARWDVPNGDDTDMGNYLVLMDTTTNPATYQLYLHLAQGSIPEALRTTGTYVAQGQFIGMADDTGQSTGHHLHFQVHTNPASYWGTAVDIKFTDVDINGGRPRILSDKPYCKSTDVCEQFRSAYVSGNTISGDTIPPRGGLFEPATGFTVNKKTLHIEGWASDLGSGLDKARLIAYYNDAWVDIGSEFSTLTFALDWDMCASGVPDGPVSLAVKAWDKEDNPSQGFQGLTHLVKNFECSPPPPACTPGPNQVAIFSGVDFRGSCQKLGVGDYPDSGSFTVVGNDNVESILVGSNVLATLYSDPNFSGRSNSYATADSNLDEEPIGRNKLSSLKVLSRTTPPNPPSELVAPSAGAGYPGKSSLTLSWRDPGGGTQYQVRLGGQLGVIDSPWLSGPFWHLDSLLLTAGDYTWKVRARNCPQSSCQSGWSSIRTFTITSPPADLPVSSTPFTDNLEGGSSNWSTSGLWNRLSDSSRAHSGSYSWYYGNAGARDYASGAPNMGDLTLRPVTIPAGGYLLRFWYRYQTEGPEPVWDQRWLQISTDGGPFVNVKQIHDDVADYWLRSTLDLTSYAGKSIQVRFHFETLDEQLNSDLEGWYIDDLEIIQLALPACSDGDNIPANATILEYGQPKSGGMCPTGDVDYYRFEGTAGDRIVLDIDTPAVDPIDNLDLILYLLDGDGTSVLAIHDDEIYAEILDPHLGYELVRTGTYYVKARLWAHPTYGDLNFTYQITLLKDNNNPTADFSNPLDGAYLPDTNQLALTVGASDNKSGISRVEFLYHSGDWAATGWQILGTDQDGADGWGQLFDTASLPEQTDINFFARIYDWAGNWAGTGAWNLGIDRTAPVTAMSSLANDPQSTAVKLQWTSADNLSGLQRFDVQSQVGFGTWSDIDPDPPGLANQAWFVGVPGVNYGFRMRGVDVAGNQEDFPTSSETRTTIPSADVLCSTPDVWDSGKDDNSPSTSSLVNVNSASKTHNFCNPLDANRLNDEDWIRFNVEIGETYVIQATPLEEMSAAIVELYAANGSTLITSSSSSQFGSVVEINWTSNRTGKVYLRVRHTNGLVAGNIVSYQLSVLRVSKVYLPLVNH